MNLQDKKENPTKDILKLSKSAASIGFETATEAKNITQDLSDGLAQTPPIKTTRKFWRQLGPGFVAGAADDDASGVATYSQAGAAHGFKLLWLAPLTLPMTATVQEMCARIGLATGRGLAANIKKYFPKPMLYIAALLLFAANAFNIGADLGAMAEAVQLLAPNCPFWLSLIGFTFLSLIMQIFLSYNYYARFLKYLTLILLVYIVTVFWVKDLNWIEVLSHTVIPTISFNKENIILLCGILGTTISPYLFFWETSQEVETKIADGQTSILARQTAINKKIIRKTRFDVWAGILFANLIMFFIMVTCGATLFKNGIININTAADAAAALRPFAGDYAYLLFSLGIIGTGFLGIPVLAGSASYAIAESFNWKEGLNRKFHQATAFYGVIILAMLVGLGTNFLGLDPIKALIYAAVLNGIVAPVILVFIVLIAGNKKIMGNWANSLPSNIFGWIITILMILASALALYFILF